VVVLLAAISIVAIKSEGESDQSSESNGSVGNASRARDFDLAEARRFDDFTIYWLGESFSGLPLTGIHELHDPGIAGLESETLDDAVQLTYGDCKVPAGEESCSIPLAIIIQPYCQARPEDFDGQTISNIRGADVKVGGSLVLWTKDVYISISGTDLELVKAAAENLVALTGDGPKSPSEPLGPPTAIGCGG